MTLEELQLHDQLAKAMIKIHNLHIALNKKVAKNKNQALEITKLLEQKKDLQEINDTQKGYIKNLEANLRIKVDYISLIDAKIKELQNKLNQANRVIKIGIDNSSELVKCLDRKDEDNKQLQYDYETLRLQNNKKMFKVIL